MKKLILMMVMAMGFIANDASAIVGIKIKVSISSKAYWNGSGCTPRDKGACVHIDASADVKAFSLENADGVLTLTANTSVLKSDEFAAFFVNGYFNIGELSFEKSALEGVGYSGNTTFYSTRYTYTIKGENVVIKLD